MGNLWKIFENTHSWGQHVEFWGGIFHWFCGPMWSGIFQHPPSKSRLHVEPGRSHRIAGEPGILVMFIRSKWTYAHCGQGILLAVWVVFFEIPDLPYFHLMWSAGAIWSADFDYNLVGGQFVFWRGTETVCYYHVDWWSTALLYAPLLVDFVR